MKPFPLRAVIRAATLVTLLLVDARNAVAADDEGPWSLSGRVGAVSNYVSRGLTQTWGGPAAQAEIEVEHDGGFYAGSFVSNVSNNQYPGGTVELELWAGYERELTDDVAIGIEGIYYAYPGANFSKGNCNPAPSCPAQSFNTFQGRIVARWRWLSTRFGYAFTDYFGGSPQTGFQSSTRGTWYWEVNAAYPLPFDESWELLGHLGYTHYSAQLASPNPAAAQNPNYWDWRLGVTKSFKEPFRGWRLGAYYTQASNRAVYDNTRSLVNDTTRDLGRPTFILGIDKTF